MNWNNRMALALFSLLFVNILLGKLDIMYRWNLPFLLGDTAEFLLLLCVTLFFALGILSSERKARHS